MKLYFKECRRIATSFVYLLFVAVLIFSWWGKFHGVTKTEIDWAMVRRLRMSVLTDLCLQNRKKKIIILA